MTVDSVRQLNYSMAGKKLQKDKLLVTALTGEAGKADDEFERLKQYRLSKDSEKVID